MWLDWKDPPGSYQGCGFVGMPRNIAELESTSKIYKGMLLDSKEPRLKTGMGEGLKYLQDLG